MGKKILDMLESRITSFYSEALQIQDALKKENPNLLPKPRMAVLHPNYTCNQNCIGCDYSDLNHNYKKEMTRDEAKRVTDEIIGFGIRAVEFAGGGEPTLDPNFLYLATRFKERVGLGLLTNGSFLHDDILDTVIRYFSYVRVSLESGSKETFVKVKRVSNPNAFDDIVRNLRNALELRQRHQSKISISMKFTVGELNWTDMEKGINLAMDIGVDSIQFTLYENVNCKLTGDIASITDHALSHLKQVYKDRINITGSLIPTSTQKRCWLNPIFTLIDAYGDVYICPYYRHRKNGHTIGNIFRQDFSDIWFSDKHLQALKNIEPHDCNVYNCRFHRYNPIMEGLMIEKPHELDFI